MSRPPSSRPTDAPAVATAAKMPNAFARSGRVRERDGEQRQRRRREQRAERALQRPGDHQDPKEGASPPRNDAAEKPIRPPMKVHLRPKRSPIFPPTSSRLPNASA